MARTRTPVFNPHTFLSEVGRGKMILPSPNKQMIFSQGDTADAVFYIQAGKVKLTVVSQLGKKPSSRFWKRGLFLGNPAWPDTRFARRPQPLMMTLWCDSCIRKYSQHILTSKWSDKRQQVMRPFRTCKNFNRIL